MDITRSRREMFTFIRTALCLQTPNRKVPIGTILELRVALINLSEFSHNSLKLKFPAMPDACLAISSLSCTFPAQQVQIKGCCLLEPTTAFRNFKTEALLSLPPKQSDTNRAKIDALCKLSSS